MKHTPASQSAHIVQCGMFKTALKLAGVEFRRFETTLEHETEHIPFRSAESRFELATNNYHTTSTI